MKGTRALMAVSLTVVLGGMWLAALEDVRSPREVLITRDGAAVPQMPARSEGHRADSARRAASISAGDYARDVAAAPAASPAGARRAPRAPSKPSATVIELLNPASNDAHDVPVWTMSRDPQRAESEPRMPRDSLQPLAADDALPFAH